MALDHTQLDKLLNLARRGTKADRNVASVGFVAKLLAAGVETMADLERLMLVGTEPGAPISQKELRAAYAAKMRGDHRPAEVLARRAARSQR